MDKSEEKAAGIEGYCIYCGWPVAFEGHTIEPRENAPRSNNENAQDHRCDDSACVL